MGCKFEEVCYVEGQKCLELVPKCKQIELKCFNNYDVELELTLNKIYYTESIDEQLIVVKNDIGQYEKYSRTRFEVIKNER